MPVGTLVLPNPSDVRAGVQYGADGTEFTGTALCSAFPEVSGTNHSPAEILRWVLVAAGVVGDPRISGVLWPCYTSLEPNLPDECVTTFDTNNRDQGRIQIGGKRQEHYGVQIRIRSKTHSSGWPKADTIKETLDQSILRDTIIIGSSTYCVHAVSRTSGVLELGKELAVTKRHVFTINCVVDVRLIA